MKLWQDNNNLKADSPSAKSNTARKALQPLVATVAVQHIWVSLRFSCE